MKIAILLITLISINVWALFVGAPAINSWEKSHDYPFGRMCDPNIFNLYQSTCK